MYIKKRKDSTDPALRSLLQKSVRRGAAPVVQAVTQSLIAIGDRTWLRSRTAVITFEEAWPLGGALVVSKDNDTKIRALLSVTRSTKQKDAAGLGALAFALHTGDRSMEDLVPAWSTLRLVAEALTRPPAFFQWALNQTRSESSVGIVNAAQRSLSGATWGWDKATILAAALLAISSDIPTLTAAETNASDFPYWVALDKHTPEGREALMRIATRYKIKYRQLIWASFYCESALVNALSASPWFQAEQHWRLRKAGLTIEAATDLWHRVRDPLREELTASADALRDRVYSRSLIQPPLLR